MSILAWDCRGNAYGAKPIFSLISSTIADSNVDFVFFTRN